MTARGPFSTRLVTESVVVALGSNMGDRMVALREAVAAMGASFLDVTAVSSVYESAPVGAHVSGGDFLNAVVAGSVSLSPRALLDCLLDVEREAGRERTRPGAPRPLDLDLVFYGRHRITEPGLHVPHPRWRERSFVLAPLAEVVPGRRDPETGSTVQELWTRLQSDLEPVTRIAPPAALDPRDPERVDAEPPGTESPGAESPGAGSSISESANLESATPESPNVESPDVESLETP